MHKNPNVQELLISDKIHEQGKIMDVKVTDVSLANVKLI